MKSISLTIATILIIAMIFIIVGIYYGYNTLNKVIYAPNNSSSNLTSSSSTNTTSISSEYIPIVIYDIPITIYNTQNISTPKPFQQDIAICNGNANIGPNFAYIDNVTLFNQINTNGQNVYFENSSRNMLYSWYEGQLNYNGVACDVWWVKLPNGIPANSNITIYMLIGNYYTNYYPLYYPYVGTSPQVISGYDNGNYTFIAYGYFNNTFDGWSGYMYSGVCGPVTSSNGIEILSGCGYQETYILPPNNWNIPKIPLIVEEAWYDKGIITYFIHLKSFINADSNAISLFGNTSQQIYILGSLRTLTSNLSTYAQFDYYIGYTNLGSAITNITFGLSNIVLNYTSFPTSGGTVYSYLIVNSSYAQAGYYYYNSNQVWVPLTLLDMYPLSYNSNYGNYTYYNLNYNPFQYGTLEISAGDGYSDQYVQWVVARAYPPNGVMPSIYIG
ncbi:MAG: hypothetical protein L7G90_00940 [Candidatus Nanopusillus sp.]|nr:hypothetical protein [Candidatus Nanopusillus sp.]